MPDPRQPLLLLTSALILASGCGADSGSGEEGDRPWFSLGSGFFDDDEPRPDAEASLLGGAWAGPDEIGGCLDASSWLEFGPQQGFAYQYLNANACGGEDAKGLFTCAGMWTAQWSDARSGELSYGCQSELMSPSAPDMRALDATFAIIGEGEQRQLTFKAWRIQPEGHWVRQRHEQLDYPPSAQGFPREQSINKVTSTLRITRLDGAPLGELSALAGSLEPGELVEVTLQVEVDAEAFFSFNGERAKGSETFDIPGRIMRAGEGRLQVRAQLEGANDYEAWTEYLRARGVLARHGMAGGAFALAFVRTLTFDVSAPQVVWASGAWESILDVCERYGDRAASLRGTVCPGG